MPGYTSRDLDRLFGKVQFTKEQSSRAQEIADAGRQLAEVIFRSTPDGPDKTVAIRKVREAVSAAHNNILANETAREW